MLVCFYEAVGTMLFVYAIELTNNPISIAFSLFSSILLFGAITGGHFNPAVTFAFIFRRDKNKMNYLLALSYMMAQALGAFTGALLLEFFTLNLPALDFNDNLFFLALCQELLGSLLYVFFFMTSTDE